MKNKCPKDYRRDWRKELKELCGVIAICAIGIAFFCIMIIIV